MCVEGNLLCFLVSLNAALDWSRVRFYSSHISSVGRAFTFDGKYQWQGICVTLAILPNGGGRGGSWLGRGGLPLYSLFCGAASAVMRCITTSSNIMFGCSRSQEARPSIAGVEEDVEDEEGKNKRNRSTTPSF